MPETYEEACRRAATSQGLDPIRRALEAEGLATHVDQTGGFCMCLRVNSTVLQGGYVWVTDDTPAGEEHEYIVCLYGPQDEETGYDQEALREQYPITTLEAVVETVRELIAWRPSPFEEFRRLLQHLDWLQDMLSDATSRLTGETRDLNLARAKTVELGAYVVLLRNWAEGVDHD